MPSEHSERHATQQALDKLYHFSLQPAREGITFTIARLTNDIFATSFLGGGDCTPFTPQGERGILTGQDATAHILAPGGGAPSSFPINLTIDLNAGQINATWTAPGSAMQNTTFDLVLYESIAAEQALVFYSDRASDKAAYALNLTLFP